MPQIQQSAAASNDLEAQTCRAMDGIKQMPIARRRIIQGCGACLRVAGSAAAHRRALALCREPESLPIDYTLVREVHMPIFVDIDNSNLKDKRFKADKDKVGDASAKAEEKMQKTAKAALADDAIFTTSKPKNAKGYVITLTVTKCTRDAAKQVTECWVEGDLARYPQETVKSGAKGNKMFSAGWHGHSKVLGGTSDDDVVFCLEDIVKKMMKDGITEMKKDFADR